MTDTEKKIAEVLNLTKPVSDCPECGGLGEIGSLGSRRKCECLYIRVKTLKRELDRRDEENRKLRQELEEAKAEAELEGQLVDDANSDLNEALEENETLRRERNKLIECLRWYAATENWRLSLTHMLNDGGKRARDILREIGVTVDV